MPEKPGSVLVDSEFAARDYCIPEGTYRARYVSGYIAP